ncbi:Tat pathway signal protein [Burkholderia multivorans]|nr:Tat pathway signal protein [Burkholderia multivorans]MCO8634881.1 Tat pathway signal protein [Burkholderia multivorans]
MRQNPLTSSRRKFLAVAPATAAAPLLGACGGDDVASAPVTDAALAAQMSAKLNAQLGDAATVDAMLPALADAGFAWALPTIPAAQVGAIVAFGFGGRAAAFGAAPVPGPVNEAIADAVFALRQKVTVPIYAQQEVASVLASKYGLTAGVTSIATPAPSAGNPMPAMRRRDLYLLSNAGMQLGMLRLELINREYPNG